MYFHSVFFCLHVSSCLFSYSTGWKAESKHYKAYHCEALVREYEVTRWDKGDKVPGNKTVIEGMWGNNVEDA